MSHGHGIEREYATCFIAERRSARHYTIGTAYLELAPRPSS